MVSMVGEKVVAAMEAATTLMAWGSQGDIIAATGNWSPTTPIA